MPKLTSAKRASRPTLADYTSTPPPSLTPTQSICRVIKAVGNNNFTVSPPKPTQTLLVELPPQFRNLVWLKNGGYVVIDSAGPSVDAARENKLDGEIINVVREEREWRKMGYWPEEFVKKVGYAGSEGDDESEEEGRNPNRRVGEMPPSDDEEE
ncbi:hypothetical protein E2P81_ATG03563 [Venturia nashicola]|uniref:S1-like domain-containing protein n=1 Tax=Venturia nashicola TaxID=86259 RepID=A0A4Z1PAX6_9PEZI|nr:hypothetical protein E6O75_ATG03638 [Venturia nashicola]TLD37888.1 hypothetical protein E2P81_ATG03563 [Venturia nashicola]